jgi:hypothetical protein
VPATLIADWWGLGPYGKRWAGGDLIGHSGTNLGGSSYLLWSREHALAVATTVNTPPKGYPFADRAFRELFGTVAGIAPPAGPPRSDGDLPLRTHRFVGTYEMSEMSFTVTEADGSLLLSGRCEHPGEEWETSGTPLVPLTRTTFRTADANITGGRGWAMAFLGDDGEPATHLVNGFYALPRVGG